MINAMTPVEQVELEMPDEDVRLMLAFQAGDEECFNQLFQKYKGPIVAFACRFSGRPSVAEELAQEIFVKCYMAAPKYQPSARFSSWLFRIARNHCLNEIRRQDYRNPTQSFDETWQGAGNENPETHAHGIQIQKAVMHALAELPEKQRTALLLNRFHAMPYESIAETMDTSLSAVKSLINRAKKTMTKRLDGVLESGDEL
jgi:RNA polymerase sigma-70 factor, ECF subfamily